MKSFLKRHAEGFLIGVAILFFCFIAVYFVWGIADISTQIGPVVSPRVVNTGATTFDLKDAATLDLKGSLQQ